LAGIGGRFDSESVAGINRNTHAKETKKKYMAKVLDSYQYNKILRFLRRILLITDSCAHRQQILERAGCQRGGKRRQADGLCGNGTQGHHRSVKDLEKKAEPKAPLASAPIDAQMRYRLRTKAGREFSKNSWYGKHHTLRKIFITTHVHNSGKPVNPRIPTQIKRVQHPCFVRPCIDAGGKFAQPVIGVIGGNK